MSEWTKTIVSLPRSAGWYWVTYGPQSRIKQEVANLTHRTPKGIADFFQEFGVVAWIGPVYEPDFFDG